MTDEHHPGNQPYGISLTRTARRHLAEHLPLDVAIGASEFITGPLAGSRTASARNSTHHYTAFTPPV